MSEKLKLWLISQDENRGYDTYDSAVVVAASELSARQTHPSEYVKGWDARWGWFGETARGGRYKAIQDDWAGPDNVKAQLIGEAADGWADGEVVCASFNAG